jgi:hypothetical protein
MVDSLTDTELENLVNDEEVNVETIEINSGNIQDLHVRSEIAPVVTPKPLAAPPATTRKRIIFDDDEKRPSSPLSQCPLRQPLS